MSRAENEISLQFDPEESDWYDFKVAAVSLLNEGEVELAVTAALCGLLDATGSILAVLDEGRDGEVGLRLPDDTDAEGAGVGRIVLGGLQDE